jgi:uncharacterized DUF497 family protein
MKIFQHILTGSDKFCPKNLRNVLANDVNIELLLYIRVPFKKGIKKEMFNERDMKIRQIGLCHDPACDTSYRKHRFSSWTKGNRKYPIPEHGKLELNVPTPWKGKVHKPQENMPPTIIFNPAKGNDFQVMITVMWAKTGDQDINNQQKVRTFVEKDGQKLLPNTAEGQIILQEIKGVSHSGYYVSVTDKASNPGEYRYMTRGAIAVGNLLLNFTILHRVRDTQAVRDALSILREATQRPKELQRIKRNL